MKKQFQKYTLPENWVWTTIDDVGIVVSGGTPSTKEARFWNGDIPWITPADLSSYTDKYISKGKRTISNLGLEYSSAKLLPPGSILFSSRAPIGYVAIAKDYLTTNQGFKNLIPLPSISTDYLFYYLQSIKSLAECLASGTTFPELSGTNFKKIPVPLPPYKEQIRLVSKIEELLSDLNDAEKTLKHIQKQLEVYRHAVLKNAYNGALTKWWRHDNDNEKATYLVKRILKKRVNTYTEELNKYKQALSAWQKNKKGKRPRKPSSPAKEILLTREELDSLSTLPDLWCWQKIGNLAFVTKLAGFEFSKHIVYKQKGIIPVIKAQNVSKEGFNDIFDSFVDKKTLTILPRIQLRGGEILFVFIGAGIGNVALVPEGKKYLLGPNVAMIKPDIEINNKYILYFLLSSTGHKHVSSLIRATAQGSTSISFCIFFNSA